MGISHTDKRLSPSFLLLCCVGSPLAISLARWLLSLCCCWSLFVETDRPVVIGQTVIMHATPLFFAEPELIRSVMLLG